MGQQELGQQEFGQQEFGQQEFGQQEFGQQELAVSFCTNSPFWMRHHPDVAMILGEHRQILDKDGALALPEQLLSELSADLVATRGFDDNLMLFELESWRQFAEKVLSRPISFAHTRNLRRRLFSSAAVLAVNQDGRIRLPSALRTFAGLQQEVVISGMYDYLEIWSSERWEAEREGIDGGTDASLWENLGI